MKKYDYLINTPLKHFSNLALKMCLWDSIAFLYTKTIIEYNFSLSYLIFTYSYFISSFIFIYGTNLKGN